MLSRQMDKDTTEKTLESYIGQMLETLQKH